MMQDISVVIKNLLGGVDAKQVRKVAAVVTDAMSTVCGEKYVMIPASQLSEAQKSKAVKRPKRWAKTITGIKYDAKPNGFAIVGEWANIWDLSAKLADDTWLMVSVPGFGLMLGRVKKDHEFKGVWDSGKEFVLKDFEECARFEEGDYAGLIANAKNFTTIPLAA
tara:strand:+ start:472 stop:966 length:495 start_codon:yes stop_codon:yes gene_type:complete